MSGLFLRSHMNAGQDGFRDESSKQMSDFVEGHWGMRRFSRHGSIDHADAMLEVGDLDGYAVWKRILRAVEELQRATPGARVH